jgi:hypothetical protein
VLLLQFHVLIAPALADSVTITTSTSTTPAGLQGRLPVTKVGALLATDALAILNGTEITIESKASKSGQTTHTLLQGTLLNTKPTSGGGATSTAYFTGGDNSYKLKPGSCPDKVTTVSGITYTGSLTSVTPTGVSIETSSGPQSVAAQDIAELHSARAYKIEIPGGNNPQMSMSGTCVHAVAAAEKGSLPKKLIIVGMAVALVTTAIVVPVAVATASHHHSNNNNLIAYNLLIARQRASIPPPIMPAHLSMPVQIIDRGSPIVSRSINSSNNSSSNSSSGFTRHGVSFNSNTNSSSSSSSSSTSFMAPSQTVATAVGTVVGTQPQAPSSPGTLIPSTPVTRGGFLYNSNFFRQFFQFNPNGSTPPAIR